MKNQRFLEKSQWWSREDLERLQNNKLQNLIKFAYDKVPYYNRVMRKSNIKPDDIKSRKDLTKIPVLTKDIVRNNFKDLFSNNANMRDLFLVETSGSTGTPFKMYKDKNTKSWANAARLRGKTWCGWEVGEKSVSLWGNLLSPSKKSKIIRHAKNLTTFQPMIWHCQKLFQPILR